ncbi:MAG: hypothetical protein AB7S26_06885 [Sandaracinaceae bacterium]
MIGKADGRWALSVCMMALAWIGAPARAQVSAGTLGDGDFTLVYDECSGRLSLDGPAGEEYTTLEIRVVNDGSGTPPPAALRFDAAAVEFDCGVPFRVCSDVTLFFLNAAASGAAGVTRDLRPGDSLGLVLPPGLPASVLEAHLHVAGSSRPSGPLSAMDPDLYVHCASSCVPRCGAADCGPDGCGGNCGVCHGLSTCQAGGMCACTLAACSMCTPDCAARSCGDDGCGGSCGACSGADVCVFGGCACRPDCVGRACGDDGCGGSCGDCAAPDTCSAAGVCECIPRCDGRECGDDGCGGTCGECDAAAGCSSAGICQCRGGRRRCGDVCTDVATDPTSCGACGYACAAGQRCEDASCVPDAMPASDAGAATDASTGWDGGTSGGTDAGVVRSTDGGDAPIVAADAGCSCRAGAGDRAPMFSLLALVLGLLARRRRR